MSLGKFFAFLCRWTLLFCIVLGASLAIGADTALAIPWWEAFAWLFTGTLVFLNGAAFLGWLTAKPKGAKPWIAHGTRQKIWRATKTICKVVFVAVAPAFIPLMALEHANLLATLNSAPENVMETFISRSLPGGLALALWLVWTGELLSRGATALTRALYGPETK